jgi:hypothetical protein
MGIDLNVAKVAVMFGQLSRYYFEVESAWSYNKQFKGGA